ncbi:ribonuclease H-like domain-containing protein [Tanacetum coccineum]|uniref:Ribonuclease H-like domain-containing protein n=1 Tax=Tanacetum coccineum TaxID=301880 RepID=A0ABQ5G627_9ASTR
MHYRLPHPSQGILGPALAIYASQATTLPSAFSIMPLQDPTWHMDTGAPSLLNFNASNLSTIFDKRLFQSIHVSDGKSIPITNTCHIIIPSQHRPLHLHNVLVTPNIIKNLISVRQFTRDNNCTIEFDAFGFSVKDYLTRHILLQCDSLSDLYPVTKPSTSPTAFLSTSASTWHQRLGHPGDQKKYALLLLKYAHMVTCNLSRTPVDTKSKLGLEGAPVQDPTLYRSLVGGSSTLDLGLHLYASYTTSLVGYTDADCAGCLSTRSAEAEYRGVANVVAETTCLHNLLRELHSPLSTATLVYCDTVSVVYMSANLVQHQRMKHTEIDIHFIRDMVTACQVRVIHVPSRFQYADIFTKGLPSALFE